MGPGRARGQGHHRRAEAAHGPGAGLLQGVERAPQVVAEAVRAEALEGHVLGAVARHLVSRGREPRDEPRLALREVADGEERAARAVAVEHLEVALDVPGHARRVALAVRDHRAHVLEVDAEEEGAERRRARGRVHGAPHSSTRV